MSRPVLVACSHGTSSEDGRRAIRALVEQVRAILPDVRVEESFVDVQQPEVADVVAEAAASVAVVVVPLLLSTGYHTRVDIARAVEPFPHAVAAPALGPHDLLALTLEERLREADVRRGDAIVLAAAGSSDPAAEVDVIAMAARLGELLGRPVSVGFAAGAEPRIGKAVETAREAGAERVVAASYVLAPGFFAEVIARSGADVVTSPLAPDLRMAALIAERYEAACAALTSPAR
ncbi:sirohydrochlorin chelatase [Microbacterium sp. 4R-513]|uniref:sirohydrochlorin chelatase n=1 Tax=Microbacterium sp. 4R-513 TaxID=2567934 RepID=UPI0013E17C27|nr:CbiX/SirB N-terminal domain-containing protein [Microbacterium sp. 4R-513]QIG40472.1 sirohydrochlorin chelatase [Microbacterium sp. 4R-513]